MLSIPRFNVDYEGIVMPKWEEVFGNKHLVTLELCSGNGSWIIDKALKNSEMNFVAVEKRGDRVKKIVSKRDRLGLTNLFVVWGEAYTFLSRYVASGSIYEVHINFPDPWPKLKHAKHRLMRRESSQELERVLQKEGRLTFVTDDRVYLEQTLPLVLHHFTPLFPSPHYVHEVADYGTSFFEELWRSKGKEIYYLCCIKK